MKTCVNCTSDIDEGERWYREEKYNRKSGILCHICYHSRHNKGRQQYNNAISKEYNKRAYVIENRIRWQRERLKNPAKRMYQASHKALSRGLPWEIPLKMYEVLISKPCHYCKKEIEKYGGGLDRVDNSRGYLIDNVITCCKLCNIMKHNLRENDFYQHIELILSNRFKNPTTPS